MTQHDPLCNARSVISVVTTPDFCDCRKLRTARLQGPVRPGPQHAPLCWCNRCLEASDAIHGATE